MLAVAPCILGGRNRRFGGTYYCHRRVKLDGCSLCIRNIGNYLKECTVSQRVHHSFNIKTLQITADLIADQIERNRQGAGVIA